MKKKSAAAIPVYKNPAAPAARRVKDLLARMTLEEKAAQMMCVWQEKATKLAGRRRAILISTRPKLRSKTATASARSAGPAMPAAHPSDAGDGKNARGMAELTNAIQKFFIENSRLGIPVMFHEECLHGHAAKDATSFPQPIGLGATFNPELVEQLYTMTAEEARVRGAHQALTPVVDVARDPRWGRVEETYGEDPFLNTQLGIAAVRGFQGDAYFQGQKARHRHAETFCRARPAGIRPELRAGECFRARVARNVFASVQGLPAKSRRDQRDGELQRN